MLFGLFLLISMIMSCQYEDQKKTFSDIDALPMNLLSLDDFSEFRSAGENWSIAGNVQSDYLTEQSMEVIEGEGILVNIPSIEADANLFTELEHGDLELKLEFLVPKGSNSGIYFQGRYEVQILDSWGVREPGFADVGGIYERWDASKPEGERGFEGSAPMVNAGLAPGLWQEYHIIFRAPRFDEAGNKVDNARFEKVYLNGALIQEDVEVTGPTRAAAFDDEAATGPLMLQGDHGPVAFRNFRYKAYSQTDSLSIGEIEYKVYDYRGDLTPVDFDGLELLAEGVTDSFRVGALSPQGQHYAMTFSGVIEVPVTGDYLFQTLMNNGGNLYINDELVVENTGEVNIGEFDSQFLGTIIHLTEGTHRLDLSYFQKIWGRNISVFYEGPNMERRTLASTAPVSSAARVEPVVVAPGKDAPVLIGGFVNFGDEKRTHTLSVGHPEGIHYSYDLNRASLLSFWREPFADVTQMWEGRGHEQLLVPMNAAVEESSGITIGTPGNDNFFDNQSLEKGSGVREYQLNAEGHPVFISMYDNIQVEDFIRPAGDSNGFVRTLTYRSGPPQNNKVGRLAQGDSIELLSNGLYRINGRYYISIEESNEHEPEIAEENGIQALLIPILRDTDNSEIQYQLIW